MDTSSISSLSGIYSDEIKNAVLGNKSLESSDQGFSGVFQAALTMLNETNDMQNAAESAEIQFALGESNNTHDLQIAQQKANIALQYTVAVRNKVIDAYKEIMNISI